MISLDARAVAAQATLDRFKDRPWAWGHADCAQLVRFHLSQLGLKVKVAKAGSYSTPLGAKRALRRLGHDSLGALASSLFPTIAPAAALVGDLIELPSEGDHPLGALTVAVGNGRVLGWHEDAPGAVVMQPTAYVAAWRVG